MKGTDTSYGIGFVRAMGMLYPEEKRLYFDPISEKLLTGGNKLFVKFMRLPLVFKLLTAFYEKTFRGMLGYFYCRFRYYDEVIEESLENAEIDDIVNLGAGMDPRAYFISGIENVHYFEVDHPSVIEQKKRRIEKVFGKLPEHVTYVSVDFNTQDVADELQKAGHNPNSKTLFIWESVSAYLTKDANDAVFRLVSNSGSGSKIAFSYAVENLVTGENLNNKILKKLHKILVKKHKILIHGFAPDSIEDYLSGFRLSVLDHAGPEELKNRYETVEKLGLDVLEVERLVVAEVR